MTITIKARALSFLLALSLLFTFTNQASADLPCGNIIDFFEEIHPIEDCEDPFGKSDIEPAIKLEINGTIINDGDVIEVEDPDSAILEEVGDPRNTSASSFIYKHDGDDYRDSSNNFRLALDGYGTYTLVTMDEFLMVLSEAKRNQWLEFLIPTAHAQEFPPTYTYVTTFTVVAPSDEEEIDPLLLEYAPILRMHPDEDYFPMSMEEFITDSALWDGELVDEIVLNEESLTPATFAQIVEQNNTEDYYLAYSDPNNPASIDLDAARTKYGTPDPENVTVYAHRMTDSTADKDYIVLQYWQFYAMNNWAEQGGFNNHEGDFESVFIFLDAETEEPEYVAYSAHHNNGDAEDFDPKTYDSVRRAWDSEEVTKDAERLVSYVSLGSHANYPYVKSINTGVGTDITSNSGVTLDSLNKLSSIDQIFLNFSGKWGSDLTLTPGGDGPRGPGFLNVGGTTRFLNPVAWAGIDTISQLELTEETDYISFPKSDIEMQFTSPLPAGTTFNITPYQEPVTEGLIPDGTKMLPIFWDLESSLENDTFSVDVTFAYEPELITELGGNAEELIVFYFNPETATWEPKLDSNVNVAESTVTFTNTTFSRYGLGLYTAEEPPTTEELFAALKAAIKDSDLSRHNEKRLLLRIKLAEKMSLKNTRISDRTAKFLLRRIDRMIERLERRDQISPEDAQTSRDLIAEIKMSLSPQHQKLN